MCNILNDSSNKVCILNKIEDLNLSVLNQISLNGTVFDFSVDPSSIEKEDILNIHQYLMIKNNIK